MKNLAKAIDENGKGFIYLNTILDYFLKTQRC